MKKPFIRMLAVFLCVATLLPSFSFMTLFAHAATEVSSASETVTGITESGVQYRATSKTSYIGNRTYQVDFSVSFDISEVEKATSRTSAENGYYEVETSGYYLLEAWGGEGGDGQTLLFPMLLPPKTEVRLGGNGGDSGYVNGLVYLEKGQVLLYSVGTAGGYSLINGDNGGGVNGDGGTHGDLGTCFVGGGGGYTAIYVLKKSEFKESYIDKENNKLNIPETIHNRRYIMIAGGGGGGGAGNQLLFDQVKQADGGNGGIIASTNRIYTSGANAVEGYIYPGADGKTNGTKTAYIGRGGTNVPGKDPATVWGVGNASTTPNDWSGANNPELDPGSGGAGNYRGGGGGSGYCGGSGGIMESIVLAREIGGGGGGSSFVARYVNDQAVVTGSYGSNVSKYLRGTNGNPSDIGGGVAITLVGKELTDNDIADTIGNTLKFSSIVSPYFEILPVSAPEKGKGTLTYENAEDGGTTAFTYSGIPVKPMTALANGEAAHVSLVLHARRDFFGGFNVPLFSAIATFRMENGDTGKSYTLAGTESQSTTIRSVNVPIDYKISTVNSHSSGPFTKKYSTFVREDGFPSDLSTDWRYCFINTVGDLQYADADGNVQLGTNSKRFTETETITVSREFRMKNASYTNLVGSCESPFVATAKATHTILAPDTGILNGLTIFGSKSLDTTQNGFSFRCATSETSAPLVLPGSMDKKKAGVSYYIAPVTGYYTIYLKGGDGGEGGSARLVNDKKGGDYEKSGGNGGKGTALSGVVYLQEGDTVTFNIGARGSDGTGDTVHVKSGNYNDVAASYGGYGGKASSVDVNGTIIAIAGGGGGGGGTAIGGRSNNLSEGFGQEHSDTGGRGDGYSDTYPYNVTFVTSYSSVSALNGGKGGNAEASVSSTSSLLPTWKVSGGDSGNMGKSYVSSQFVRDQTYGEEYYVEVRDGLTVHNREFSWSTEEDGFGYITLVGSEEIENAKTSLFNLNVSGTISKYFDVTDIDVDQSSFFSYFPITAVSTGTCIVKTTEGEGPYTVTYKYYLDQSYRNTVGSFRYELTENDDGTTSYRIFDAHFRLTAEKTIGDESTTFIYTYEPTFSVNIVPRDGFAGGNDVPVVNPGTAVVLSQGEEKLSLNARMASDYANVEIGDIPATSITPVDKTIHVGDTVNYEDLYEWHGLYTDDADAWKYDFVEADLPTGTVEEPLPSTQTVPVTATLAPKTTLPETPDGNHATVLPDCGTSDRIVNPLVTVTVDVIGNLTNLTTDGADRTETLKDYVCTLTPDSGYEFAEDVTVKVGETILIAGTDYSYDENIGLLIVNADVITDDLTVEAAAKPVEYTLHYRYYLYDEGTGKDVLYEHSEKYVADASIDYSFFDGITPPEKEGYIYHWDWETDDGMQPETMPAHNVDVTGSYLPEPYAILVHYRDADGNAMKDESGDDIPDYDGLYSIGDTFSIPSPAVPGYLARVLTFAGTIDSATIAEYGATETHVLETTVVYDRSTGKLTVVYEKPDGTTISEEYEYEAGSAYEITPTAIGGYDTDPTVVSGTMPENGDSVTVYVKYVPKTYALSFVYQYVAGSYPGHAAWDLTNATVSVPEYRVAYGEIYGYNAASGEYAGLPTPFIEGYKFVGWYSDPSFADGTEVTEDTVLTAVPDAEPVTLYACYEVAQYNLVVRYHIVCDEGDFPADTSLLDTDGEGKLYKTYRLGYGESYTITLTDIPGYYAYADYALETQAKVTELTGTMPGSNTMIDVTYEIRTLTFNLIISYDKKYYTFSDEGTATTTGNRCGRTDNYHVTSNTVKYGQTLKTGTSSRYIFDFRFNDLTTYPDNGMYAYNFIGWTSESGNFFEAASMTDRVDFSSLLFPEAGKDTVNVYETFRADEAIAVIERTFTASTTDGGTIDLTETYYYSDLQEASAAVSTYMQSASIAGPITLTVRRNAGNPQKAYGSIFVDLDSEKDTSTYGLTIVLDADLISDGTNGNDSSYGVKVYRPNDSGKVTFKSNGTHTISVENEGDAVALDLYCKLNSSIPGPLYLSAHSVNGFAIGERNSGISNITTNVLSINVSAISDHGNAAAFYVDTQPAIYSTASTPKAARTVEAPEGNAYYFYYKNVTGTPSISFGHYPIDVNVSGKKAYGVYFEDPEDDKIRNASVYLRATDAVMNIVGTEEAYGVHGGNRSITFYGKSGGDTTATTGNMNVTSTNGNAYGVYVAPGKKLSACYGLPNTVVTSNGEGCDAIGVYLQEGSQLTYTAPGDMNIRAVSDSGRAIAILNEGGTVSFYGKTVLTAEGGSTAIGIDNVGGTVQVLQTADFRVDATSEGLGIGVRSSGGQFGSDATDIFLRKGAVSGSDYGFYCEDGSIYAGSYELFAKGSSKENAFYGCTVEEGHAPFLTRNESYTGYYFLAYEYYTYTFIDKDLKGVTHGDPVVITYQYSDTKIDYPAFEQDYPGCTKSWPTVTFDYPETGTNTDIYMIYERNTYTFTYVLNGGKAGGNSGPIVRTDLFESYIKITDPTKTGYTFKGWFLDDGTFENAYTPDKMPPENMTVYAKYEINQYTITFTTNCDQVYPAIVQDYATTILPVDDPQKTGYRFSGWTRNNTRANGGTEYTIPGKIPAEDVDLYANWELITYYYTLHDYIPDMTLNFHWNDGTGKTTTVKLSATNRMLDMSLVDKEIPTSDTKIFMGWWNDPTTSFAVNYCDLYKEGFNFALQDVDHDNVVDLYAHWYTVPSGCKAIMLTSGGSTQEITNAAYAYDQTAKAVYFWRFCPVEGEYLIALSNSSSSSDYYKQYQKITLEYDDTDGESVKSTTLEGYSNFSSDSILPIIAEAGQVACFKIRNGSRSERYQSGTDCDGKAKYSTRTVAAYTSSVTAKNNSAPAQTSMPAVSGSLEGSYNVEQANFDLPEMPPPDDSHVHTGWAEKISEELTGSNVTTVSKTTVETHTPWATYNGTNGAEEHRLHLYPTYGNKPYLLSFDTGGGDPIESRSVPFDTPFTGEYALPTPNWNGFTFLGWYEDEGRTTPFTDEVMPAHEVKLYAKWQSSGLTWESCVVQGVRFTGDFTGEDTVTIRRTGTVSIRYQTNQSPAYNDLSLSFATGLAPGTILSLADLSGSEPIYYTYTATEAVNSLSLKSFIRMANESPGAYDLSAQDFVISICYLNAPPTADTETVSLKGDGESLDIDVTVNFCGNVDPPPNSLADVSIVNRTYDVDLTVPSLGNEGFSPGDSVYLRTTADGLDLSAELTNGVESAEITEYGVILPLGTVADHDEEETLSLTVNLSMMKLVSFDHTFRYDVIVIAEGTDLAGYSYEGKRTETVASFTQHVSGSLAGTVNQTLHLSKDATSVTIETGFDWNVAVVRLYQVKRNETTGEVSFCVGDVCTAFLGEADGVTYSVNGSGTVFKDDRPISQIPKEGITLPIGENAEPGTYYFVIENSSTGMKQTIAVVYGNEE